MTFQIFQIINNYKRISIGEIMLSFREFLNETSGAARTTVQPETKEELMKIIKDTIKEQGNKCDLNFIDTSKITDMSRLFRDSKFTGDISKWDVSNVVDMNRLFRDSKFNGDISKWNTSKVENMSFMFSGSVFDGNISKWNTSKVKDMNSMFYDSPLEGHEPDWYDLIY